MSTRGGLSTVRTKVGLLYAHLTTTLSSDANWYYCTVPIGTIVNIPNLTFLTKQGLSSVRCLNSLLKEKLEAEVLAHADEFAGKMPARNAG